MGGIGKDASVSITVAERPVIKAIFKVLAEDRLAYSMVFLLLS